jgi:hypothetical protein
MMAAAILRAHNQLIAGRKRLLAESATLAYKWGVFIDKNGADV